MPTLETPPNPAPPTPPPPQDRSPGRVRAGRFGELDHSELIHLLDTLDDERAKARFRESIYISLFFWIAVVVLLIFAPRIFPRRPEFVMPALTENKRVSNLNIPPDVQRALEHAPRFKTAPKPPPGPKTPEAPEQQAQPQPPAPQPAPQQPPPQQQQQAPQQAAPPPVVQQSPLQQPRPQQQAALPSAPTPSPAKPDFGNPNTSARDMVQQAARAPRGGGGYESAPSGGSRGRNLNAGPEILSDTLGVNFDPYLAKIMREIKETWIPLIPEEALPPLNKQGETQIRFIILPDGKIGGMVLEGSTHDDAINRSCWGSITGVGVFPPLPKEFHGPNLELRIHYFVNKEPQ